MARAEARLVAKPKGRQKRLVEFSAEDLEKIEDLMRRAKESDLRIAETLARAEAFERRLHEIAVEAGW